MIEIEVKYANGKRASLSLNDEQDSTDMPKVIPVKIVPDFDSLYDIVHSCVEKVLDYRGDSYEDLLESKAAEIDYMAHEAVWAIQALLKEK